MKSLLQSIVQATHKIPDLMGGKYLKQHKWLYFFYRQLFHLLGGLTVGIVTGLLEHYIGICGYVLGATVMISMIIYGEWYDETGGQPRYKTLSDIGFWIIGLMLGCYLVSFLY